MHISRGIQCVPSDFLEDTKNIDTLTDWGNDHHKAENDAKPIQEAIPLFLEPVTEVSAGNDAKPIQEAIPLLLEPFTEVSAQSGAKPIQEDIPPLLVPVTEVEEGSGGDEETEVKSPLSLGGTSPASVKTQTVRCSDEAVELDIESSVTLRNEATDDMDRNGNSIDLDVTVTTDDEIEEIQRSNNDQDATGTEFLATEIRDSQTCQDEDNAVQAHGPESSECLFVVSEIQIQPSALNTGKDEMVISSQDFNQNNPAQENDRCPEEINVTEMSLSVPQVPHTAASSNKEEMANMNGKDPPLTDDGNTKPQTGSEILYKEDCQNVQKWSDKEDREHENNTAVTAEPALKSGPAVTSEPVLTSGPAEDPDDLSSSVPSLEADLMDMDRENEEIMESSQVREEGTDGNIPREESSETQVSPSGDITLQKAPASGFEDGSAVNAGKSTDSSFSSSSGKISSFLSFEHQAIDYSLLNIIIYKCLMSHSYCTVDCVQNTGSNNKAELQDSGLDGISHPTSSLQLKKITLKWQTNIQTRNSRTAQKKRKQRAILHNTRRFFRRRERRLMHRVTRRYTFSISRETTAHLYPIEREGRNPNIHNTAELAHDGSALPSRLQGSNLQNGGSTIDGARTTFDGGVLFNQNAIPSIEGSPLPEIIHNSHLAANHENNLSETQHHSGSVAVPFFRQTSHDGPFDSNASAQSRPSEGTGFSVQSTNGSASTASSSGASDTTIFSSSLGATSSLDSFFSDVNNGANEEQLMHYQWTRVTSFALFPLGCGMSTTRLAREGWYYVGSGVGDLTKCFSCGVIHQGWQRGEDPRAYHNPNCRCVNYSTIIVYLCWFEYWS